MAQNPEEEFSIRVRSNYDSLSRFYDLVSGRAEMRITREAIGMLSSMPEASILDIGCGTGGALLELEKIFKPGSIISGLDISLGMCEKALKKTDKFQERSQINICCGNGLSIPFIADSMDQVFMSFTLELFPTRLFAPLFSECRRVLRSSGGILLVCMAQTEYAGWIYRLYCRAHEKYPHIIDCRPIDVRTVLAENGFMVLDFKTVGLYGLPVSIVQAGMH